MKRIITFILITMTTNLLYSQTAPTNLKQEKSFLKETGIRNELGYAYYRRGFGLFYDVSSSTHIVKGLYFEPGIRLIAHKFNMSHFISIATSGMYEYQFDGILIAGKIDFKYRQPLFEHFEFEFGLGFSIGPEFSRVYSFHYDRMFETISMTVSPDITIGVSVPYKQFVFAVSLKKMFPISLGYYDAQDNRFYNNDNYSDATFPSPIFNNISGNLRMCFASTALVLGATYFFDI